MGTSARALLGLHLLLALYSVANIFSKLASGYRFGSVAFALCYAAVLVILAVYALGWQQAIKRMPLTTAYANKAVTIVWGIAFGALFFGEQVGPAKVAGAALIMAGVVLFGIEDARFQQDREDEMNRQLSGPERSTALAGSAAGADEEGAAVGAGRAPAADIPNGPASGCTAAGAHVDEEVSR